MYVNSWGAMMLSCNSLHLYPALFDPEVATSTEQRTDMHMTILQHALLLSHITVHKKIGTGLTWSKNLSP